MITSFAHVGRFFSSNGLSELMILRKYVPPLSYYSCLSLVEGTVLFDVRFISILYNSSIAIMHIAIILFSMLSAAISDESEAIKFIEKSSSDNVESSVSSMIGN